jgi:Domain of unknown function (DUF4202)
MPADADRFNSAIRRFDAANAEDPQKEVVDGVSYPKELLYAQRMTAWLERFAPEASEPLRLAARCQHIRRWVIPRSHYAMDRRGYLQWRTTLAKFHAETAAEILREVGYEEAIIRRVQSLLRKEGLKRDPEVQCLEDVICLVFLESYCADFARHQDAAKMLPIIRKTWEKMSPRGREVACTLNLPPEVQRLIEAALAAEGEGGETHSLQAGKEDLP